MELTYKERTGMNERRKLKKMKRLAQFNKFPECSGLLPVRYCVLDRIEVKAGYTEANTRLLCPSCDRRIQEERNFS
jgi:ribosomal protein L37AE/L43A